MGKSISAVLALILSATTAMAFESAFSPPGADRPGIRHTVEYSFATASSLNDHSFRARSKIGNSDVDSWAVSARAGLLKLRSGSELKQNLWSPSLGASYQHSFAERNIMGAQVNIGSPSDHPFASFDEVKASVTAFYQLPSGSTNSYWFFLNYSNFRGFAANVPLPGFAYMLATENKKFMAFLGFPMFVFWSPVERVWIRAGLFAPPLTSFEISAMPLPPLKLAAGFGWSYQDFILRDRTEHREQFFYDQKKAYGELSMPLQKWLSVAFSSGYLFDRRSFKARSIFREKDAQVNLGGSGFFAANLTSRF